MAIVVFCPVCKTRLTLGDDRAGSAFECPRCEATISVPTLLPPPPPPPSPPRSSPPPIPPTPPPPPPVEYDWTDLDPDSDDYDPDDYAPPRRRRRKRSGMVNAVAILYLVTSLLNLACAVLILAGGTFLAQLDTIDPKARPVIGGIAGIFALVVIILGIPDLLAAYGIWNRRYWGYVLGLVLAGINALWAMASIVWGDVCSVLLCGSCAIFAFVVLCNSRYAAEFS